MKLKTFFISMLILISTILFVYAAGPTIGTFSPASPSVDENQNLIVNITLSEQADNGTLAYTKNVTFGTLTKVNDSLLKFEWTPTFNDAGTHNVLFNVSDDNSSSTSALTITVNNVNRAPTINLPASETLVQGFPETLNLDSYASDADGDTKTYSATSENQSIVNCTVSGSTLTMTPKSLGTANCTVEVSDSALTAQDTIILTVEAQNPAVTIDDVDFGNVELNTTTSEKSFIINNIGNVPLTNIDKNWTSTYDKYNIQFTSFPLTLAAGSSDTAYVKIYIPSDHTIGSLTIPVNFTSNEVSKAFNLKANVLGRLRITDLDVKVDDKTDSNIEEKADGYKIVEKAKPESHVKFDVRVENAFPDGGLEINDIIVTITIEEIDDGEDLEEESDSFDLKPGKSDRVSLDFDVPLKVNTDDYAVIIEVEGEDENGNEHRLVKTLYLEVDKETHNLKIRKAVLSPETVQCSRTSDLDVAVINIGDREEDEVAITVQNSALGINLAERDITLSEDPDDDENEYEKTFRINIGDNVKAGTYTIEVRTYYGDDKLEDIARVNLEVKDCKEEIPPEEEEEEETEVITPPKEEETIPPAEEVKKFTETTEYVLLLVLVNIVVVIIVISLLVVLLRK